MRLHRLTPAVVTVVAAAGVVVTWGSAVEVPGTAGLNVGGAAQVSSVSCRSAGNCSAGGFYFANDRPQAFLVSEVKGTWSAARPVPGLAALSTGNSQVISVSCGSPGNCAAGGFYAAGRSKAQSQAFVVNEVNGTWQRARVVPGTAGLNKGRSARLLSVSCARPGSCSAGGFYTDAGKSQQAFVVTEARGTWQRAREVRGTGKLNKGGLAAVTSVSCAEPGTCSAGGTYLENASQQLSFVVSEVKGTWRTASEAIPGAGLSKSGMQISSVSCASPGNCAAAGSNGAIRAGTSRPFVADEAGGRWGKAMPVPGVAALNVGDLGGLTSVSCPANGDCSAGGFFADRDHNTQAFVVNEVRGTWRKAIEVPGTAVLNRGGFADADSLSCAAPGDCSAGGSYEQASGHDTAFVVNEVAGAWQKAIEVPGIATLDVGDGSMLSTVSCPAPGRCSAGGQYTDSQGSMEAFVVAER